jgi:hypothetical protein
MLSPVDFIRLGKRQAPPEVQQHLKDALTELSFSYESLDPDFRLAPAQPHPGYLTTLSGEWRIFVPWPLVRTFPSDEVLAELLEVGVRIACAPVENLCISGSSATHGAKIEIADLDFCQYIQATPAEIVVSAAAFKIPAPERMLTRAAYGNPIAAEATPPWPEKWPPLEQVMSVVQTIDGSQRFMTDFLGYVPSFGILPMSNIILASDFTDHYRGAAQGSYVYQEAVAVPTSRQAPPWLLFDPAQIARYLEFLRGQINEHKKSKPVKAVKRALSLALTIRLWSHVRKALAILRSPECVAYVKASRAQELERHALRGGEETRAMVLKHLVSPPSNVSKGEAAVARDLPRECERFIDALMKDLDELDNQV